MSHESQRPNIKKKFPQKIQHFIFHSWRMQGLHYTCYSLYVSHGTCQTLSSKPGHLSPPSLRSCQSSGTTRPASVADWTWDTTGWGPAGRNVQLGHWMAAGSHNQWGWKRPLRPPSSAYGLTHLASYTMALRAMYSLSLNIFRVGDSTTFWGSPFQCIITFIRLLPTGNNPDWLDLAGAKTYLKMKCLLARE